MGAGYRVRTAPTAIQTAEWTAKALDLRRRGLTIRDISRILDCSLSYAHKLVSEGIRDIPREAREALVFDIYEREMALIKAHWKTRKLASSAKVIQDSDKLLMSLFGLEKHSVEISGGLNVGATPAEARAVMRELFGSVGPEADDETIDVDAEPAALTEGAEGPSGPEESPSSE